MTLSVKQRRRYLLLPIPALAAVAAATVFATSALANAAALEWTNTKTPDLGGNYMLGDVHALAEDDVWAVGTSSPNGDGEAVTLHWNGSEWENPTAPAAMALGDITAVAGEDVWTVGVADRDSTLTARWDGEAWEDVPTPQPELPEDHDPSLRSVDGVATDDVWAVGNSISPMDPSLPIIQHWNGTEWSLMEVPLPDGAAGAGLTAVRANAPDDVWAVGGTYDANEALSPLLLHWDGGEWSVSPLPFGDAGVYDVDVTEDGRIWLAGAEYPDGDTFDGKPLLVVGDGRDWTRLGVPSQKKELHAVEPDGAGGVVAVGDDGDKVMVVRSDGETVTMESTPDVGEPDYSRLESVSLVPGTETLWTVGFLDKFASPVAAFTK